jgi:hypothetical protein
MKSESAGPKPGAITRTHKSSGQPAGSPETLAEWAAHYAATGLEVFPVNPATKAPLGALARNGHLSATTDPETIRQWWIARPDALIGARIPKNLVVLDIDPRHDGLATWAAIVAGHDLPTTRLHKSGRNDGGFHIWFQHPGLDRIDAGAGIDVLHHGHRYSILPPSPHPATGSPYFWVQSPEDSDVAEMPAWLIDAVTPPPPAPVAQAATKAPTIASNNAHHDHWPTPAEWYNPPWAQILTGWQLVAGNGDDDGSKWAHPTATAASSASIRHGRLFVYSPTPGLPVTETSNPKGLTKFRAAALLNYGGEMSAAAKAIREIMPDRVSGQIPSTAEPLTVPYETTCTSPVLKGPGNYTDAFWETTELLTQIRQAAWASYDAPAATLGALLARTAAAIPPSVQAVVIHPASGNTFKSPDSLNLIVGTVATSGGGKSSSVKAAERLLPYERPNGHRLVDRERSDLQLGSGQGIDATYLHTIKDPEDAKKTITKVVDNPKALFIADEGEIYDELTGGGGSTLKSTLRKAAFGETLGAANASIETRRHVGAHQYRLAMILCFQIATAKPIADDHLGGTPQRIVMVEATKAGQPDPAPAHLGPILADWEPPPATAVPIPIRLPEVAAKVIIDEYLDEGHQVSRYGSHRRRNQSKLAVVLQLLHDPTARTVDPKFWGLAETIVDGSDRVYGLIDAAAAHDQAQTNQAAGRKQAHIARVVEDDKIGRALGKQARYVANKCHASPGQQFTRKELQQATKGKVNGVSRKDVGGLDAIIKQALDLDWVTEKGGRYSSGTDRP